MLLDALRDFEWLNEPLDVNFEEAGMRVLTYNKTDFWQSVHHRFGKDNGHFFYARREGDFTFGVTWRFENSGQFDQCGIMLRIDEKNWFKASVMSDNEAQPRLASCVTNCGYSDLAPIEIPAGITEVSYKIKRFKGDYILYYSLDGINFKQLRMLHLLNDQPEVKVGAYICSPQREAFEGVLTQIEVI